MEVMWNFLLPWLNQYLSIFLQIEWYKPEKLRANVPKYQNRILQCPKNLQDPGNSDVAEHIAKEGQKTVAHGILILPSK